MGLRNVTLFHRVYAHAAEPGETGGRIVDCGECDARNLLPDEVLISLDRLMESLSPETEGPAFAVQRFGIPQSIGSFVCLVVCHPSVRDGMSRPASVTHARVLKMESGEAWLDADALIALARAFPPEVLHGPLDVYGDFANYLADSEPNVEVALWSADVVNDVSRPFASYVVGACLSRLQKEATEFPLKPDESFALLHDLAAAWAVLPLSIQLNCPFSLHAGKGARVKALFSTLAEEGRVAIADQVRGWAEAYVDWVHDRPDDARQLIENREVRDLKTLDGHFRALIDADTRGEIQPRGESEMSKQKRSSPPAEQYVKRGGLDPALIEAINVQVRAAEQSLREYVNQRVRSTGVVTQQAVTRQRDEAAAAAGGGTALPAGQWWTAIGTAAAAVIVLTFAAVYLFNTTRRQSTQIQALEARLEQLAEKPAAQPTHHPSTTTSAPPPALVPATRLPGNTWTSQFLNLANDPKRLASIAEAVMTEDETKRLPADVAKKLAKVRKGLAAGTAPGRNDRGLLLTILFQCLADQARMDDDAAFAIDGNFDGTPKQLQTRLKNQLRVDSRPGDDEQDEDFEAETILRWAEEKGR